MKSKVIDYYNNFKNVLIKDGEDGNLRHQHVKSRYEEIFKESEEVLELGCGLGLTTKYLLDMGIRATGVDISPELIKEASKKYGKENFVCEDILKVDLNKKFDGITLIDSMEHLPKNEFEKIFQVIEKHSKEGTKVFINIPFSGYQKFIKKYRSDLLQVIDEAIETQKIVTEMKKMNFELKWFNTYGLWEVKEFNYAEFLFIKFGEELEEELWGCLRK